MSTVTTNYYRNVFNIKLDQTLSIFRNYFQHVSPLRADMFQELCLVPILGFSLETDVLDVDFYCAP